jgi:hypothetical protein
MNIYFLGVNIIMCSLLSRFTTSVTIAINIAGLYLPGLPIKVNPE